ncbi:hypothetical protein RHMOL_Rhmol12G0057400 [Rhododendron molle]|uniref:Uncharacterized protein n=1 Tax=Rhododendron molle TaxID=49168 RepID=A0ACC0LEP0_RHOML|nr:hypothetical protein RHMOL_Rhmol12G0057400 [Rhododendron molle]
MKFGGSSPAEKSRIGIHDLVDDQMRGDLAVEDGRKTLHGTNGQGHFWPKVWHGVGGLKNGMGANIWVWQEGCLGVGDALMECLIECY